MEFSYVLFIVRDEVRGVGAERWSPRGPSREEIYAG
jgi:hypothetical protein